MNKATRDAWGDQLMISAKNNNKIVILSADLSKATKVDKFAKEFPERFFEVGIAENNMIGIASGLSEHGYKVFATSFSSFLTGKYDTIRCSLAYPKCPVILIGTHGGMAIGRDGVTQMGLEDIAIMRALPNMTILNPATYNEAKGVVEYLCNNELNNPHYLRLGRQPVKEVFPDMFEYKYDGITVLKEGSKGVIFSTGCVLPDVLEAVTDIDITVVNVTNLKPISNINKGIIEYYIKKSNIIFTVEDHSIIGGLGTIIAEEIAEIRNSSKLIKIGINDIFPESGSPEDLYEKYGLSANKIKIKIDENINFIS